MPNTKPPQGKCAKRRRRSRQRQLQSKPAREVTLRDFDYWQWRVVQMGGLAVAVFGLLTAMVLLGVKFYAEFVTTLAGVR